MTQGMAHRRRGSGRDGTAGAPALRVWLLLVFGTLIGGGLAIERTGQGEYIEAALAGLVCVACLAGMAWAMLDCA